TQDDFAGAGGAVDADLVFFYFGAPAVVIAAFVASRWLRRQQRCYDDHNDNLVPFGNDRNGSPAQFRQEHRFHRLGEAKALYLVPGTSSAELESGQNYAPAPASGAVASGRTASSYWKMTNEFRNPKSEDRKKAEIRNANSFAE